MFKIKSKPINLTLKICLCCIGFLVAFAFLLSIVDPDKPFIHVLMNPGEKTETEICLFSSASGWSLKIYDDFDGLEKRNLAMISKYIYEAEKRNYYAFEPTILLVYSKSSQQEGIGTSKMNTFVQAQGETESFKKKIDGKNVSFWRFSGNKCPASFISNRIKYEPNSLFINDNYKTVAVVWIGDGFGFQGFFWGFPENEKDFWKTIESIKWKGK